MLPFAPIRVAAVIAAAVVLWGAGNSVDAFNPQPEPPADTWNVQGFVDMTALTSVPTGAAHPFHVDPSIIGDGLVDFYGGVIATFVAPTNAFSGKPEDGIYHPDMRYFRLQIGDTNWDEAMIPPETIAFQLQGGLVIGIRGIVTATRPEHPDVAWFLPSSPGMWVATDDRDGVNLGTISGSYGLRDAFVGTTCDFDGDADCDVGDLNAMLSVGPVAAGIPSIGNEPFDLTSDGLIDNSDVDQWLADAALINGFATPYKRGDATLNGIVDGRDFGIWNAHKFTSTLLWDQGNFDGDAVTDGRDFGFWNSNKFTSSAAAFAVPEPGAVAVCLLVSILVFCERRSPITRAQRSAARARHRGPFH